MTLVDSISAYLGIHPHKVAILGEAAPKLYRRYLIPKKNGGHREIFHPAKETKALQSAAIDLLYKPELTHESARSYVRGMKAPLVRNALPHARHTFLLKLDFTDFFPSITPDDLAIVCGARLSIDRQPLEHTDIAFLKKLLFVYSMRRGWFLGIGAPSSPFVSNWVMYDLDATIAGLCESASCNYTRYADDLCFSADDKAQLLDVEHHVRSLVSRTRNPNLQFNDKKRRVSCRWSRRCVTGLVITPRGDVRIPRDTKRYIRGLLLKRKLGTLPATEGARLRGFLGHINDCEPTYLQNLVMKYGADTVAVAMKGK